MPKFNVSPDILKTISTTLAGVPAGTKPIEATPKRELTAEESIRPARTGIAHARGGNKGK